MGKYFGTDGIRGTANEELTSDLALKVGQAAGLLFRNGNERHRVIIGKDTRESSYMLEDALAAGFLSVGMEVLQTGPLPTPGIAMLTPSMRCELGIMISASHNPYRDNGIKLFDPFGHKLSDEKERAIEELIDNDAVRKKRIAGLKAGRAKRIEGARDRYIEHAKHTLPKGVSFGGLRVVIDCANGAAYQVAPEALWELGAEVITIGVNPNGENINDECGSTDPEQLMRMVHERRADLGIALDGDADRVLIVDEKKNIIDGDQLLALFAKHWKADGRLSKPGVVSTVMANLGLQHYLTALELALIRTPVGDRYVVEQMREQGYNVGGEQSGHFILSDFATTGDGLVTALQVLSLIAQAGRPASEVCKQYEPVPQVLKNVNVKDKSVHERPELRTLIAEVEQGLNGCGRLLVRASGTERKIRVMAEGDDMEKLHHVVDEVVAAIQRADA